MFFAVVKKIFFAFFMAGGLYFFIGSIELLPISLAFALGWMLPTEISFWRAQKGRK